jgi:hypothetical protein
MIFCIARMIPHGLAGNIGKVKVYFGGMMVAAVGGVASGFVYYYGRGMQNEDDDLQRLQAETEALAAAGRSVQPANPTKSTKNTQPNRNEQSRG